MDISLFQGNSVEFLPQFLTSLAIGLLIGLERERTPSAKAGLRTFTLVALLGTLAAMLSEKAGLPWLLVAGWVVVGAMIIAAYVNSPTEENDPGTTTVAALLMCYGLGALIWYGQATLAIMLAIGTTTLLYFKPELRGMTQRLTRRDLVSILQFSVLTFVILPILPDQNYGPYGAFNPHQAWLMVVLISGLSLAGYISLHWIKQRYSAPLLGFLRRAGIEHRHFAGVCAPQQEQREHGAPVRHGHIDRQHGGTGAPVRPWRRGIVRSGAPFAAGDGYRPAIRFREHAGRLEQTANLN